MAVELMSEAWSWGGGGGHGGRLEVDPWQGGGEWSSWRGVMMPFGGGLDEEGGGRQSGGRNLSLRPPIALCLRAGLMLDKEGLLHSLAEQGQG